MLRSRRSAHAACALRPSLLGASLSLTRTPLFLFVSSEIPGWRVRVARARRKSWRSVYTLLIQSAYQFAKYKLRWADGERGAHAILARAWHWTSQSVEEAARLLCVQRLLCLVHACARARLREPPAREKPALRESARLPSSSCRRASRATLATRRCR
jgi:hypothetical protein